MAATLIPPQAENLFEVKSVWSHTHTYKSYTLTSCSMTQPQEDLFTSVCTRHGMRAVFPYICCHMRSLRCVRGCQNQFSISASPPFFHLFEDGGCHVRTFNYHHQLLTIPKTDVLMNPFLSASCICNCWPQPVRHNPKTGWSMVFYPFAPFQNSRWNIWPCD